MGGEGAGDGYDDAGNGYDGSLRNTDFRERLRHGDTYGLLLLLILVGLGLLGVLESTPWSRFVLSAVFGGILLLAFRTSRVPVLLMRIASLVIAAAVIVILVQAIADSDLGVDAAGYLIFPLVAAAPIAILVRIARHPVVNLETILGALSAYLLIGVVFAGCYRALESLLSGAFFAQTNDPSPIDFVYFSFTTLTTTGFGDFTPAQDSGKVLVNLEQLTGQIFLVTIVAGLVSSFGRQRRVQPE